MDEPLTPRRATLTLVVLACVALLTLTRPVSPSAVPIIDINFPKEMVETLRLVKAAFDQLAVLHSLYESAQGLRNDIERMRDEDYAKLLAGQARGQFARMNSGYEDRLLLRDFATKLAEMDRYMDRDLIGLSLMHEETEGRVLEIHDEIVNRFRSHSEAMDGLDAAQKQVILSRTLAAQTQNQREVINEVVKQLDEARKKRQDANGVDKMRQSLIDRTETIEDVVEGLTIMAEYAALQLRAMDDLELVVRQNMRMNELLVELHERELEIQAAAQQWQRDEAVVQRTTPGIHASTSYLGRAPQAPIDDEERLADDEQ